MSLQDMLLEYQDQLKSLQRRIAELQLKRKIAERSHKWADADSYGNRIIMLERLVEEQQTLIHEIERH